MICLSLRLFPTHSGIQSYIKGEGFAHVLTRSLHFALLRFELRLAAVPLCSAWLPLFMRRGETDGQISSTTTRERWRRKSGHCDKWKLCFTNAG